MVDVDVCVVSYNTPVYLSKFLQSYRDIERRESNLFVRVNSPTKADESVLAAEVAAGLDGTLSIGCNIGYARSVNMLVEQGSAPVVGIFNADVKLSDGLWECVGVVAGDSTIGALGPRLIDGTRSQRLTCGGGVIGTPEKPEFRAWREHNSDSVYGHPFDCLSLIGAAFFMRREVLEQLARCPEYVSFLEREDLPGGPLLPTDHWFEETFCMAHARHHGYRMVYYGPVVMTHYSQKSGAPPGGKGPTWKRSKALYQKACDAVHGMPRED